MSYILEALKKSEKERIKEEVPDLLAEHSHLSSRRRARKPLGGRGSMCFAGGFMLLLFGGWLFWWQGQEKPTLSVEKPQPISSPAASISPVSPAVTVASSPVPAKPVVQPPEMKEEPSLDVRETVPAIREDDMPVSAPDPGEVIVEKRKQPSEVLSQQKPEPVLPYLEELTPEIRKTIPQLSFAGHVYSEDSRRRLIIINNRIVREGDLVSNGLSLERVTPDGVVLRYKGLVFQVSLF